MKVRAILIGIMVAALCVAAGCGASARNDADAAEGSAEAAAQPLTLETLSAMATEGRPDLLQLSIQWEDAGQAVFRVENTGKEPVTLTFMDGQSFDMALYRDEERVWLWSHGRVFTAARRSEALAPGEALTYVVDLPELQPGTYQLKAWLVAESPVQSPITTTRTMP